jgi:hypothetical protein
MRTMDEFTGEDFRKWQIFQKSGYVGQSEKSSCHNGQII